MTMPLVLMVAIEGEAGMQVGATAVRDAMAGLDGSGLRNALRERMDRVALGRKR